MKRAACYVRVSTEEQKRHGLSVDSQIQALTDYCKENNYEIADIYNDAGLSASKNLNRRTAIAQLCEDCKAHKFDIVLFTKLDRWFRSVEDYYKIQPILDECNVPWRAIWEDYETETSTGKFKVNIMLAVAQAESDRTSERIKAVNEYRRAKGAYVGSAPTGYKLCKSDLLIDENAQEAVKLFFNTYMKSFNIIKAIKAIKGAGIDISKTTALNMLKNPVYKGEAYGSYKCEPYLTEEEFDRIQTHRPCNQKQYAAKVARTYYFTGIMICAECGKKFHGTIRPMSYKGKTTNYKFYRCIAHSNVRCDNAKSITEMKLERYLLDNLEAELNGYILYAQTHQSIPVDNKQQIAALESKLKRVGERYEDGDISRDEYKSKRTAILSEIEKLKKEQTPKVEIPKALPDNWRELYDTLDDEHKKTFWASVLDKITMDKDGNISLFF